MIGNLTRYDDDLLNGILVSPHQKPAVRFQQAIQHIRTGISWSTSHLLKPLTRVTTYLRETKLFTYLVQSLDKSVQTLDKSIKSSPQLSTIPPAIIS